MKNLVKTLTLFIAATILFTSCKGSLTKRHYRNGYHFNMAGKNQTPKQEGKEADIQSNTTSAATRTIEIVKEEIAFAKADSKNETTQNTTGTNLLNTPKAESYYHSLDEVPVTSSQSLEKNTYEKSIETKIENKKVMNAHHDDSFSLLWTVILVILILWAIGFLGGGWGLGGLIHVLLVIALILLILWLLRVI